MKKGCNLLITVIFWGLVFLSPNAPARVIESVEPPNVKVYPLFDPRVDFALRIEAINRAQSSIDMVVYMHTGELGIELNRALQAAIQRGVKVRFITEGFTTIGPTRPFGSNLPNRLANTLSTNMECPGEVLCVTALNKLKSGLHPFDSFHEKILRVDAGTENEVVWIGGRNNDHFALKDLDFSIVMRPIRPEAPSACSTVGEVFEDIWRTANRIQKSKKTPVSNRPIHPKVRVTEPDPIKILADFPNLQRKYNSLVQRVLDRGPTIGNQSGVFSFTPKRFSISSNEFFNQMIEKQPSYSMASRTEIVSDNIDVLGRSIDRSKEILITAMAFDLPEDLREKLKDAVRRGAILKVVTNSPESEAPRIPQALQFDQSMRQIEEIYKETLNSGVQGRVEVYVLDPKRVADDPEYAEWLTYVHRKMVITDQEVFIGSDNFTNASRLKNNEVLAKFEDPDFVKYLKAHYDSELRVFRPLPCSDLLRHAERGREWIRRVGARIFRQFL